MVVKRTVKGSVFSVAKGSNFVSCDIRIAVNDIRQMLHYIDDAVAERGSEVGDINLSGLSHSRRVSICPGGWYSVPDNMG